MELAQEWIAINGLLAALSSIQSNFDFILIDCPPSLDILTVNALIAADRVLIPIQCEYFALEGVSELMETIQEIRKVANSRSRN